MLRSNNALLLVGIVCSCHQVSQQKDPVLPASPPLPFEGTAKYWGRAIWAPELSGYVSLDGAPVHHFYLAIAEREDLLDFRKPSEISSGSGGFTLPMPHIGKWFLVVSGSGFARNVVAVDLDGATERIQVKVTRGFTVSGSVLDESGAPVDGAIVRISQVENAPNGDVGWDLARGNLVSETAQGGRFDVSGFSPRSDLVRISAAVPSQHLASLPSRLDRTDAHYMLTLHATGNIRGRVLGSLPADSAIVLDHGERDSVPYVFNIEANGEFSLSEVPIGTYTLSLWYPRSPRDQQRIGIIIIAQGKTTSLTIPPGKLRGTR